MKQKTHSVSLLAPICWVLLLDVLVSLSQKKASITSPQEGNEYYFALLFNPWFWISMVIPIVQLLLWTKVLSKMDLSIALPLTSLSYPATMIASHILFSENYSVKAWCGAALVTCGVWIMMYNGKGK